MDGYYFCSEYLVLSSWISNEYGMGSSHTLFFSLWWRLFSCLLGIWRTLWTLMKKRGLRYFLLSRFVLSQWIFGCDSIVFFSNSAFQIVFVHLVLKPELILAHLFMFYCVMFTLGKNRWSRKSTFWNRNNKVYNPRCTGKLASVVIYIYIY